jgi:hypothetical protein
MFLLFVRYFPFLSLAELKREAAVPTRSAG